MKLLILGASGYLGARLYSDLKWEFETIGTCNQARGHQELVQLDITDGEAVARLFAAEKPDWIVHTAGCTRYAQCEANPALAEKVNIDGTANLVAAANAIGASVIYISSDSVYNPVNVYGRTKLFAEGIVRNVRNGYVVIRPSMRVGASPNTTNDSSFNRILETARTGRPLGYNDGTVRVTWVGQVSEAIVLSIMRDVKNVSFPLCCPDVKTRFEVASDILSKFGIGVVREEGGKGHMAVDMPDIGLAAKLGMPAYTYAQIVLNALKEIREMNASATKSRSV